MGSIDLMLPYVSPLPLQHKSSETLIKICSTTNTTISISMHGCLSDGSCYETENLTDITTQDDSCGQQYAIEPLQFIDNSSGDMKEGVFWSKTIKGGRHLISYGEGFNVWNAVVVRRK